jgi:hypothetical protein
MKLMATNIFTISMFPRIRQKYYVLLSISLSVIILSQPYYQQARSQSSLSPAAPFGRQEVRDSGEQYYQHSFVRFLFRLEIDLDSYLIMVVGC